MVVRLLVLYAFLFVVARSSARKREHRFILRLFGGCGVPRFPRHSVGTGTKRTSANLTIAMDYQPVSKYRHVYCPGLKRALTSHVLICSRRDISGIPRRHHDRRPELYKRQLKVLRVPCWRRRWSDLHPKAPQSWEDAFTAARAGRTQVRYRFAL